MLVLNLMITRHCLEKATRALVEYGPKHSGSSEDSGCYGASSKADLCRAQQDPSRGCGHSGNQPDASHTAKQELPPTSSQALTRKKQNHCPGAGERGPENQGSPEQRLQNLGVDNLVASHSPARTLLEQDRGTLLFHERFSPDIHWAITTCESRGQVKIKSYRPWGEGKEPFTKPRVQGLPDSLLPESSYQSGKRRKVPSSARSPGSDTKMMFTEAKAIYWAVGHVFYMASQHHGTDGLLTEVLLPALNKFITASLE